jgi:dTDP-4-amino-4,6-dideoxygalactose transaminase
MREILFNSIYNSTNYTKNIDLLLNDYELFRNKYFSNKSIELLKHTFTDAELYLTHSATGGLEIIATLIDIQPGDEIIVPSFTFVSTANAFVAKGAIPVFIDINPETLNIDENLIEKAITTKTKAIVAMHYAGHACDLVKIKAICKKHNIYLVEDAAMGFGASFNNLPLGSWGDFSVISFDITKQINSVQGGLLIINNKKFVGRANNVYHLGTNRMEFQQNNVQYYEWVDIGSKYQMNELNAAVLFEQLQNTDAILAHRKKISQHYYNRLVHLESTCKIKLGSKKMLSKNIHEFYIILKSFEERESLRMFLSKNKVEALFHYIPLHLSSLGKKIGRYIGAEHTEQISRTILRLPLHSDITEDQVDYIASLIYTYFNDKISW